jgi:hypothetical protein
MASERIGTASWRCFETTRRRAAGSDGRGLRVVQVLREGMEV